MIVRLTHMLPSLTVHICKAECCFSDCLKIYTALALVFQSCLLHVIKNCTRQSFVFILHRRVFQMFSFHTKLINRNLSSQNRTQILQCFAYVICSLSTVWVLLSSEIKLSFNISEMTLNMYLTFRLFYV